MHTRSDWVDYAKAIGIILVVYAHVARGLYSAGLPLDEELYRLVDSVIYSFHMPLFFALSGLFFFKSLEKRGVRGLLASKVDVIVWPYILWSLIQGSIEVGLASYTNGGIGYGEVLTFLWAPRAHFWFLYALFLIFVIASLVFSALDRRWLPAVFAWSVFLYLLPTWFYPGYHLYLVCNNFVFFVFGALLGSRYDARVLSRGAVVLTTGLVFVGLQYNFHGILGMTYQNKTLLTFGLAMASILFVVSLSQWLARWPVKPILFIGASSMAIYLMHVIAGSGVRVVLFQVMGVDSPALHLLLGTVAGLGLPLVALMLIQRFHWHFLLALPLSRLPRLLRPRKAPLPDPDLPPVHHRPGGQ